MTSSSQWRTAIEGARENLVFEYAAQGLDVDVSVTLRGKGLFHSIGVDGIHVKSARTLPEVYAYLEAMRRGAQTVRWAIERRKERQAEGVERAIRQDRAREAVIKVQRPVINTDNVGSGVYYPTR